MKTLRSVPIAVLIAAIAWAFPSLARDNNDAALRAEFESTSPLSPAIVFMPDCTSPKVPGHAQVGCQVLVDSLGAKLASSDKHLVVKYAHAGLFSRKPVLALPVDAQRFRYLVVIGLPIAGPNGGLARGTVRMDVTLNDAARTLLGYAESESREGLMSVAFEAMTGSNAADAFATALLERRCRPGVDCTGSTVWMRKASKSAYNFADSGAH